MSKKAVKKKQNNKKKKTLEELQKVWTTIAQDHFKNFQYNLAPMKQKQK